MVLTILYYRIDEYSIHHSPSNVFTLFSTGKCFKAAAVNVRVKHNVNSFPIFPNTQNIQIYQVQIQAIQVKHLLETTNH